MSRANFAYAQARLHARLEGRLSETDWQTLAGSRNFGNCLDVINQTAAANVTSRLDRTNSVHAVERVLREEWSAIVKEIADWLPERWRHATRWLMVLPHLRRFEYSSGNDDTPRWLRLKIEFGETTEVMQSEEKIESSMREVAEIWRNEWCLRLPDKHKAGELNVTLTPLLDRYLDNKLLRWPRHEGVARTGQLPDEAFSKPLPNACRRFRLSGIDCARFRKTTGGSC